MDWGRAEAKGSGFRGRRCLGDTRESFILVRFQLGTLPLLLGLPDILRFARVFGLALRPRAHSINFWLGPLAAT